MLPLILEEKTGFLTSLPVEIYDTKNNLFYSSDWTKHIAAGRVLKFNMPVGEYKYNGSLVKLSSPVPVKKIMLPPRERNINNGKVYKIIFDTNPNKCSIFYDAGVILFDTSFKDAPLYLKFGIYFHELGHHFYRTEKYADLYAAYKMLDYGFNISQIGRVGLKGLNQPDSFLRQTALINALTTNNG